MDSVSQAKVILKSLIELRKQYECCDGSYAKLLSSQVNRLIRKIPKIINDEDFVNDVLLECDSEYAPDFMIAVAIEILEEYIDSVRPSYLQDLLENAEDLLHEGLLTLSAYCIRLYLEQFLRFKAKNHLTIYERATLGAVWKKYKESEVITQETYEAHYGMMETLNHMVHKSEEYAIREPTSLEIVDLLRDVKKFESTFDSIVTFKE